MNFKVTVYGALLLAGAMMALISIFLNWIVVGSGAATGWEFFSERIGDYFFIILLPFILVTDGFSGFEFTKYWAIGFYTAVAAGALIAISAVLSLLKVFPDAK